MATFLDLDISSIAKIGLMFLDGDHLEDILLDAYGHTDYDFDNFNSCKATIMKIERMNPNLHLIAVLWQKRPDNEEMAVPVVAGKALPLEGFGTSRITPSMQKAFDGEWDIQYERIPGGISHYYPVRNSDAEIVGVLELLEDPESHVDI